MDWSLRSWSAEFGIVSHVLEVLFKGLMIYTHYILTKLYRKNCGEGAPLVAESSKKHKK